MKEIVEVMSKQNNDSILKVDDIWPEVSKLIRPQTRHNVEQYKFKELIHTNIGQIYYVAVVSECRHRIIDVLARSLDEIDMTHDITGHLVPAGIMHTAIISLKPKLFGLSYIGLKPHQVLNHKYATAEGGMPIDIDLIEIFESI